MFIAFRRLLGYQFRAKRWMFYLLLSLLMICFGAVFAALACVVVAPANIETIRSFHPIGLALSALSALMLSIYWVYKGFTTALHILSSHDIDLSEKIKDIVFHRSNSAASLPLIVAIGGGTGLSSLLKGLKEFSVRLSAIVTVTDDGGSSGRLRKDLQILPPGDIRNCLVALSSSESNLSKLFQYRFTEGALIEGHSFGNLFIAAMTEVLGDFTSAVREASSILAIKGHVIPVTVDNVQLQADFEDGTQITGETAICTEKKPIEAIRLVPETPIPNEEALSAIDDANMVVMGPGSLYTSVIPNLLVPGVAERINNTSAKVVYICNVMTQSGETDGYSAFDHVKAILSITPLKRIDIVVVNSRRAAKPVMAHYESRSQYWVTPTVRRIEDMGIRVVASDLLLESNLVRHNPTLLASVLIGLLNEEEKPPKP